MPSDTTSPDGHSIDHLKQVAARLDSHPQVAETELRTGEVGRAGRLAVTMPISYPTTEPLRPVIEEFPIQLDVVRVDPDGALIASLVPEVNDA